MNASEIAYPVFFARAACLSNRDSLVTCSEKVPDLGEVKKRPLSPKGPKNPKGLIVQPNCKMSYWPIRLEELKRKGDTVRTLPSPYYILMVIEADELVDRRWTQRGSMGILSHPWAIHGWVHGRLADMAHLSQPLSEPGAVESVDVGVRLRTQARFPRICHVITSTLGVSSSQCSGVQ